ncbi:MAG: SUMF1/EgtB/PvdO family nonheme iron enzyme [Thermodesulfobacteriota bacterium]|nr:SUMF1/EgtB/PvdO family nonheme iron enzyme [Thermodesulfobacteriota bacterium]
MSAKNDSGRRRQQEVLVATVISLKGIDEAISDLNYRDHKTLKYRLIHAIREFYESEGAVTTLQGIDTDRLVKALWDTGDDPSTIKTKRKNLSSIKSSANTDFKRLYEDGKNPEGIIIGRSNVFVMSDEAKDRMLTSFTGSAKKDGGVTLEQINEVLNIVREVLSDPEALANTGNSDRTGKLSQLKNIIQGLSQQIGLKVAHGDLTDGPAAPSEVRAYETHMAHGDTKDNDNNSPSPPFTKGGDTLSLPLEKGYTGGFSGEKSDTLPRIFEDAAKAGAGQTGGEVKTSAVAGSGVAGHDGASTGGEMGINTGIIPADEQERTVTTTTSATETTGHAETLEKIAANEVDVVDTVELVEEIIPEEPESEKLEDFAETEIVDDIESNETADEVEEIEVVEDLIEKAPEEGEEVPEAAEAADLIEDLEPDEIGPGETEELEDANEVVAEEVEEAIQEIVEAEEEAAPQEDTEIVDEADLLPDVEPEDAAPEEMEEVEEVAVDAVEEILEEVIDQEESKAEITEELESPEMAKDPEEAEVTEDLKEVKLVEDTAPEEASPGESEDAQDIEEITVDEVEEGFEELEVSGNDAEPSLSAGGSEAGYSDGFFGEEDKIPKARLLAEEFNRLLGDRERFYNQYILIPAGDYIVGNKSPGKDERPEQKVHLEAFYMGRFPVINALFEVFVEKTGYKTIAERLGYGKVYYGRFKKTVDEKTGSVRLICQSGLSCKTVYGACWHQPSGPGSTIHNKRNHPVVQVSREDALAFAAWTGKRLPTEDEWEAATRTADGYVLPWGNDWQRDACNIEDRSIADTTPVDRYMDSGNNFGIIDAIGNVLEWIMEPCEPPSHAKHNVKYYVAKGGSWISGNDIRLFNRFRLEAEMHSNILGFRCVAY